MLLHFLVLYVCKEANKLFHVFIITCVIAMTATQNFKNKFHSYLTDKNQKHVLLRNRFMSRELPLTSLDCGLKFLK